ncbi:hypothetical protein BGX23_000999 [Mortierella sp. AD031]|nr:hypothetical protein BGX23_000999 [Mortierella sp. AD031]
MPSSTISKRLFVFDFDWTLIEADSDLWVAENLAADLAKEQESFVGKILWTDLQDILLQRLFERGVTKQDLERTLHKIPFTPEIIAALRLMKSHGAELCILSDANTFYIDCILKGKELQNLIDSQNWDQVIYMGDSTNDFCPSTRLQSKDIVLARADLLLEKHIKLHLDMVKAQVIYWQSPADVLAVTQSIFDVVGGNKPTPAASSVHVEEFFASA